MSEKPETGRPVRAQGAAAVAAAGRDALLRETLPLLLQGAAAGALHGPIRVAHAVQAGHDGELASALAYWAARHQPLAPLPARAGTVADPLTLLRRLPAVPSKRPLIALRMAHAAGHPALQAAVPRLAL